MKKIDIAIIIGLILAVIVSGVNTINGEIEGISDKVVRLHILANSDSAEDQELKLKVRDAILEESNIFLDGDYSRLEAEQVIVKNIGDINEIAERVIAENGYNYSVSSQLVNMEFDVREYDRVTLPAGNYDALRITIGNAEGKNWWCVMYPQFCLAPSISDDDLKYFKDSEVAVMTVPKRYKIKFKIAEFFRWR